MELELVHFKETFRDIELFTACASHLTLRRYQKQVAQAIVDSVLCKSGLTFVVEFPRQSGKNELQAQIETFLLSLLRNEDTEIVKVSPTWKPQTQNAMRRLQRVLEGNMITHNCWVKESGYIYRIGRARIFFLSGSPTANVVGATASTLLECDEAQDVLIAKWDKDFAPMAASTNATRVFWGTAWSARTLLARELRAAQAAEKQDGIRRVFAIDADLVSREVPAYGKFVRQQVARLGRQHPLVKTQFFSEELDAEGGMFPARRLALLEGSHPRLHSPRAGQIYAVLVDVAGEDEGLTGNLEDAGGSPEATGMTNPLRDSTALTVIEVELSSLGDPLVKAPSYRIVDRHAWCGIKHSALYGELKGTAELWMARYMVVDATGVGAGLASFLDKALPGRVIQYVFNASTKSKLGWGLLGLIETGRLKDYAHSSAVKSTASQPTPLLRSGQGSQVPLSPPETQDKEQGEFIEQLRTCQMEITPGPERKMKWGVPDGMCSPVTHEVLHDDWILSAALAGVLDSADWAVSAPALILRRPDPLEEIDREGY